MKMLRQIVTASVLFALALAALAGAEPKPIPLPAPTMKGGKPLMEAIHERKSTKTFGNRSVTTETLSNLLWAAYGINRPETVGRTVPSAMHSYEIDIYVIMASGAYRYDAKQHALIPVAEGDLRGQTGAKGALAGAPIDLLYVSDGARLSGSAKAKQSVYGAVHSGFIGQNVYLYCASEGLGAVFREGADRKALTQSLKLRPDQEIVFTQTVGYGKE